MPRQSLITTAIVSVSHSVKVDVHKSSQCSAFLHRKGNWKILNCSELAVIPDSLDNQQVMLSSENKFKIRASPQTLLKHTGKLWRENNDHVWLLFNSSKLYILRLMFLVANEASEITSKQDANDLCWFSITECCVTWNGAEKLQKWWRTDPTETFTFSTGGGSWISSTRSRQNYAAEKPKKWALPFVLHHDVCGKSKLVYNRNKNVTQT